MQVNFLKDEDDEITHSLGRINDPLIHMHVPFAEVHEVVIHPGQPKSNSPPIGGPLSPLPSRRSLMPQGSPTSSNESDASVVGEKRKKISRKEQKEREKTALEKSRMVWTDNLHLSFISAVSKLGAKAVPKKILREMAVSGLSRENVASHLQKYRIQQKKSKEQGGTWSEPEEKGSPQLPPQESPVYDALVKEEPVEDEAPPAPKKQRVEPIAFLPQPTTCDKGTQTNDSYPPVFYHMDSNTPKILPPIQPNRYSVPQRDYDFIPHVLPPPHLTFDDIHNTYKEPQHYPSIHKDFSNKDTYSIPNYWPNDNLSTFGDHDLFESMLSDPYSSFVEDALTVSPSSRFMRNPF